MPLDLSTLSTIAGILSLGQAGAFVVLWRLNRTTPGVGFWALSAALNAAGFVLYAMRGAWPSPVVTMLTPVICNTLGCAFFYLGASTFGGRKATRRWPWAVAGACMAGYAWLLFALPESPYRPAFTAPAFATFLALGAVELLALRNPLLRGAARFSAGTCLLMVGILAYRAATLPFATSGDPSELFANIAPQAATFIGLIVWTLGWTFGVMVLISQRHQSETRQAHDRLVAAERALAAERARRGILQDLHDGLGGAASSLALLAGKGRAEGDSELLRRIESLAIEGNRELRRILNSLEVGQVGWPEWIDELRARAGEVATSHGVGFSLAVRGEPPGGGMPDSLAARSLLRAGLEAATNAARHSDTAEIEVDLTFRLSCVRLRVRDRGKGLGESGQAGHGLENLRRRAAELGGRARFRERNPGTEVALVAPLPLSILSQP